MKSNLILGISVFIFTACAPHSHYYRPLDNNNANTLNIFCTLNNKAWLYENSILEPDSVFIQSNHFNNMQIPQLMDTLNYAAKYGKKKLEFRLKDRKFHKLVRTDTITIKYKDDQRWIEEKFIIIPDNYIKKE